MEEHQMKKSIGFLLALMLMVPSLTACSGNAADKPVESSETQTETSEPQTSSAVEESEIIETTEATEATEAAQPAVLDIEAEDANLYNTKENAVPLGQWVYYQNKNYTSGEYEPFYVRIIGVSRDEAEIQKALDSYDGIMDLSLSEDQARDIGYGIVEYEIYFDPNYAASEYGITIPNITWNASAIETVGFETDGGMSYIGIGGAYKLRINGSDFYAQPGGIVREKDIFTILKNYDESEYVFHTTWYDGEIEADKARELYFAVTQ